MMDPDPKTDSEHMEDVRPNDAGFLTDEDGLEPETIEEGDESGTEE